MSIKLLICDDEKIIREGLSSLEWQQHDVEVIGTAKNGIEALEIISKIPPDIIISDVRMPQKDGIWLAEQVHNNYPDIQMIFLTGYNEFEYAQMAINYNVSKYLMKPIDEDKLYEQVLKSFYKEKDNSCGGCPFFKTREEYVKGFKNVKYR